ncbi:MAG: hypothetical protein AB8B83_03150 [Bdellovibrionales bacterium]
MRNQRLHETFAEKAMGFAFNSALRFRGSARYPMAFMLLSTGDARKAGVSLLQSSQNIKRSVQHKQTILDLFEAVKKVDNIIDEMPVEKRLALGEAKIGAEPCEFLLGLDKYVPEYFQAIDQLEDLGVISRKESMAFSNLYAVLIREGATAEIAYMRTGNVADRKKHVECNLRVVEMLGCHAVQNALGIPKVTEASQKGELSYEIATQTLPNITLISRLIEILDDIQDVLIDASVEERTGIITPNKILCRVEEELQKLDLVTAEFLKAQFLRFIAENKENPETIYLEDYPTILREAMNKERQEFFRLSDRQHFMNRSFLRSWWSVCEDDGLRSEVHPEVIKMSEKHGMTLEC